MHDFGCKEAKDMYYPELAKGVKHFKEEGGRGKMCEAVENYAKSYAEKYAEQKAESVRLNSLLESIRNLMANMKLGAEQAVNVLGINEHDREILQKKVIKILKCAKVWQEAAEASCFLFSRMS